MSLKAEFDAYVVVDWSANNQPKKGKDSVWYCALERTEDATARMVLENPATRVRAFDELRELLADFARRGLATLIGFDFALGYPSGFAAAMRMRSDQPWRETWRRISSRIVDNEQNRSNRFDVAAELNEALSGGPFPFWGCPAGQQRSHLSSKRVGRYGPTSLEELRVTERRNRGPQPVWKLCYPGAVGSQSLLGIPYVEKLRFDPELSTCSRVWPFETGFQLAPRRAREWKLLYAEVYPAMRAWTHQSGECRDKAQVRGLAEYFAREDASGRMAELFGWPDDFNPVEMQAIVAEEGWILGVR